MDILSVSDIRGELALVLIAIRAPQRTAPIKHDLRRQISNRLFSDEKGLDLAVIDAGFEMAEIGFGLALSQLGFPLLGTLAILHGNAFLI